MLLNELVQGVRGWLGQVVRVDLVVPGEHGVRAELAQLPRGVGRARSEDDRRDVLAQPAGLRQQLERGGIEPRGSDVRVDPDAGHVRSPSLP